MWFELCVMYGARLDHPYCHYLGPLEIDPINTCFANLYTFNREFVQICVLYAVDTCYNKPRSWSGRKFNFFPNHLVVHPLPPSILATVALLDVYSGSIEGKNTSKR